LPFCSAGVTSGSIAMYGTIVLLFPLFRTSYKAALRRWPSVMLAACGLGVPLYALTGQLFGTETERGVEKQDVSIAQMVANSALVKLRGSAAPYEIDIPEALLPKTLPDLPNISDHQGRSSSDSGFMVETVGGAEAEDLTNLPQQRLAGLKTQIPNA